MIYFSEEYKQALVNDISFTQNIFFLFSFHYNRYKKRKNSFLTLSNNSVYF